MNITLKVLEKPKYKKVNMRCDNVIDNKLLKYPMIADCFSTNHFTVIVGKMGQGKTSLAVNLMTGPLKKCYHWVYVIMPEISLNSIDDNPFENLPEDQIFDDLTEEALATIYENVKEAKKKGEHSLILIDDFQQKLKDADIAKALETLIIKVRHCQGTIILLQQNFLKLPKSMRQLVQNVIAFDVGKQQLEQIFEEIVQSKKDKFQKLVEFAYQDPHDWLCLNLHKSKKVYKNFDEIVFSS